MSETRGVGPQDSSSSSSSSTSDDQHKHTHEKEHVKQCCVQQMETVVSDQNRDGHISSKSGPDPFSTTTTTTTITTTDELLITASAPAGDPHKDTEGTKKKKKKKKDIPEEWFVKYPQIFQKTPEEETPGGDDMSEDDELGDKHVCPICLDPYDSDNPSEETQCNHFFHLQCCLEWKQRSDECPCCYGPLRLKNEQLMKDLGWSDLTPQRTEIDRQRSQSDGDSVLIQEQQLLYLIARMQSMQGSRERTSTDHRNSSSSSSSSANTARSANGGRQRSQTSAGVPTAQQRRRTASSRRSGGWFSKLISFFSPSASAGSTAGSTAAGSTATTTRSSSSRTVAPAAADTTAAQHGSNANRVSSVRQSRR